MPRAGRWWSASTSAAGTGQTATLAAGQLYTLAFLFSLVCMQATLVWNRTLLGLLFGQVEPDVMEASAIYLRISAYSTPSWRCTTPGRPCIAA